MKKVQIDYTNYRGERSLRTIEPIEIVFEENEFHKPAQWLLVATDVEKSAKRSFAIKDIHSWKELDSQKELVDVDKMKNRCNLHFNCDAADQKAKELGKWSAEHCRDEDCEECFGC